MDYKLEKQQEELVLNRINQYMISKGIKKADIASGLGWPPSKVTKIFSRKQGVTFSDLLSITSAMGIPLEAFLQEEFDLEGYEKENGPMPLSAIFQMYYEAYPAEDVVEEMITQELPYKIKSILNLDTKNYAIYSDINRSDIPPAIIGGVHNEPGIRYWPKSVVRPQVLRSRYDDYLEIGYWMGHKEGIALCINFYPDLKKGEPIKGSIKREFYKNIIDSTYAETDKEWFDKSHQFSFDTALGHGEICSIVYDLKNLPPEEVLVDDLKKMFKVYENLLIEASDRIEAFFWESVTEGSLPMPHVMGEIEIENEAREACDYKCFVDPSHQSFETEEGHSFVDCMHLVPLEQQSNYEACLDVKENIVCLCPTCMARMYYGKRADKEKMIVDMYYKKQAELATCGIKASLAQVLKMHHMD